jgi:hypothetical protein
MDPTRDQVRRAAEAHERIAAKLQSLRTTKVEVYLLLREFHHAGLFRYLDLPAAPAHARKICAGRRFTTWEDYLASLGEAGICFAYFAELDRLHKRFGEAFVRLCAGGIPVRTRRVLLKAPSRIADEVRAVAEADLSDADKRAEIAELAAVWRAELAAREVLPVAGRSRARRYRCYLLRWERRFSDLVGAVESASGTQRGTTFAAALVTAWREVFAMHLATGERLARLRLHRDLGQAHAGFLAAIRAAWSGGRYTDAWRLPALPPGAERVPPRRPAAAERRVTHRRALPQPGPLRRRFV